MLSSLLRRRVEADSCQSRILASWLAWSPAEEVLAASSEPQDDEVAVDLRWEGEVVGMVQQAGVPLV